MGWKIYTKASVDYANMTDETAALAYRINWSLNQPATCTVILNDDSGAKSQTYGATYLGTSAITVEQPAATEIFRGRIIAAEPDPSQGTLVLRAEDWLGQLNDRKVIFDTRENLGNNVRESRLAPYLDAGTGFNAVRTTDLYMDVWEVGANWAADAYNGMKLVLPHKYLGAQVDIQYPANEVVTPTTAPMSTDAPADGETEVHVADGTYHHMADAGVGSSFYVEYYFRSLAAHSTLVASIDRVAVTIDRRCVTLGSYYVVVYNFTSATYDILLPEFNQTVAETTATRHTAEIPSEYFNDIFDADGYCRVALFSGLADGHMDVDCVKLTVEYTVDTVHNDVHTINDTINIAGSLNRLTLADDVEADGFVDWWTYSITQPVTVYVASLVTAYDELYALNASHDVTTSTNYVCRHFHRESPLQILRELARADNTDFWLDAWDGDSLDLHWNDPYAVAGAPVWTDTDVLRWIQCNRRLGDVVNEWVVDGLVSGDYKVTGSDSDPPSITAYGQRSGYFNNPDIAINQEATDEADRRVTRMKDARFNLGATWNGFKTTTLGAVVHVHSTKLNLDTDYVVAEKEYDSRTSITTFVLTPQSTVLNVPTNLPGLARRLDERITNLESRLERGSRYTEVWT